MITINNSNQVVVKYNNKEYNIKDKSDYQKFIILITDPNETIDVSAFNLDESILDERQKSIILKYQEFFTSFLSLKATAIEEAKEALKEIIDSE